MKRVRDEQGVVIDWLVKIVLVIGVVGTILFDAGAIAWNYFGVDSTADDIALEVSQTLGGNEPVTLREQQAAEQARRLAKDAGAKLVSIDITDEEVTLKIKREATTIVVTRVEAISDWGKASATGSASMS